MPTGRTRIPRNMARIEFLACRELIESLLSQGFDKRKVHTRLMENGQITMSYDALCKVLARASRNELKIESISASGPATPAVPAPSVQPPQQAHPRVIKAKSDELQDPRNIDLKTVL